jgi:hypothetical protein
MSMRGNEEEKLDALFRAYREACPDPDASANFMPTLWARIDSRQTFQFSFTRMVSGFVTAAAALTIALGVYMSMPHSSQSSASQSYLEAVADAGSYSVDAPEILEPIRLDVSGR